MTTPLHIIRGAKIIRVQKGVDLEKIEIENADKYVYLWNTDENGENVDLYIQHPYKSAQIQIEYQDSDYLNEAKKIIAHLSLDKLHPTSTVLVCNKKIIGYGANSSYHEKNICKRKILGLPTGVGYELCEGCHSDNHSESQAIKKAIELNHETVLKSGSTVAYLYGHWWLCESCCTKLVYYNINKVIVSKSWVKDYFGL